MFYKIRVFLLASSVKLVYNYNSVIKNDYFYGSIMTNSRTQQERESFLEGMSRLLKKYELEFEILGAKDALPDDYKFQKEDEIGHGVPSFGQVVTLLNENRHGTRYNKKWTRHSLKILLEELDKKGVKIRIGHKENKTSRANATRSKNANRHAIATYKNYLKDIDIGVMSLNQIAVELNNRGSKTIKENPWSAAGCSYLLKRLRKLNLLK